MLSAASPGTPTGKRKVLSLKKHAILDKVHLNVKSNITVTFEIVQSILSTIIKNGSKIDAVLDVDFGSRD